MEPTQETRGSSLDRSALVEAGDEPMYGRRRWVLVALFATCFSGCGRPSAPTSGPTSVADLGPRRPDPQLPLFDGFEGESVAPFWRAGDAGSGRYAAGAVAVTSDHARSGTQSVRITVREGDVRQQGDDGEDNERAELDSGKLTFAGRELWYGFSMLVPPEFPIVSTRLVVAQWKQTGIKGGPLIAQRYRSGRHHLTIRDWSDPDGERQEYPLPAIIPARWNDMVYRVRLSASADGLVEAWVNGERVVSHRGPTASATGDDQVYNKIGLYRDRMVQPMSIYFDNYIAGDSRAAVDPSRFDGDRRAEQQHAADGAARRR